MNKRPVGLTILMVVNTLIGINVWLYMVIRAVVQRQMDRSPGLADWHVYAHLFLLGLLCFITANGFRTRRFRSGFLGGIALGVLLLIHHALRVVLWEGWWVIHMYPIAYAVILLGLLVFRYRRQFRARGVIEETVSGELEGETSDTSEPDAPVSARFRSRQRVLIAINLLLGVVLWLGYCTDYSFRGEIADMAFIVIVTLVAGITWLLAGRVREKGLKRLRRMACLPSLIGGGPFVLLTITVIALYPVFFLAISFHIAEIKGETVIQRAASPDGTRVANVHFRGHGAYTTGNGSIFVRVIPRWMPLLERVVHVNSRSYAERETSDYLHWIDNQTLRITGEPEERGGKVEEIDMRHVFTVPPIIGIPLGVMIDTAVRETFIAVGDETPPFDWDEHNADLKVLGVMITVALADDYLTVQELREISDHMKKMKDYLPIPTYSQFGEQGGLVEPIRLVLVDNIITLEEEREIKKWFSYLNDFVLRMWDADT